jgi:hypothetical protein
MEKVSSIRQSLWLIRNNILEGILFKFENMIHNLVIGLFYSVLDTQNRFIV